MSLASGLSVSLSNSGSGEVVRQFEEGLGLSILSSTVASLSLLSLDWGHGAVD